MNEEIKELLEMYLTIVELSDQQTKLLEELITSAYKTGVIDGMEEIAQSIRNA